MNALPPPQFVTRSRELSISQAQQELALLITAYVKTTGVFAALLARRRCIRSLRKLERLLG